MATSSFKSMDRKPKYLYKYQHFDRDGYSLDILKNYQIFFSDPRTFNDPFEFKINLFVGQSDESLAGIYNKLGVTSSDFDKEYINTIFKLMNPRVYCLCEECDNILLFSYYPDNHKGFCIGFDTGFSPFNRARKVAYQKDYPKQDIIEILTATEASAERGAKMCATKSEIWRHEKEWRIIITGKSGQLQTFPKEAIREIILGCRIEPENEQKIIDIVNKQQLQIPIYKSIQKSDEYTLELCDVFKPSSVRSYL